MLVELLLQLEGMGEVVVGGNTNDRDTDELCALTTVHMQVDFSMWTKISKVSQTTCRVTDHLMKPLKV
jgi:hypothetical protein